jgi:hypothetical protein
MRRVSAHSIWTDTESGWGDRGDAQHRGASIWTGDHSRSSHTSTGTGTTCSSYAGTYSSNGTHPCTSAASSTASSGMIHHYYDPLLGRNLARSLPEGGHESSTQVGSGYTGGTAISQYSWNPNSSTLEIDGSSQHTAGTATSRTADSHPILSQPPRMPSGNDKTEGDEGGTRSTQRNDGYHKYKR